MIAVELEVLAKKFDRFGWDRDRGSMAQDRLLVDWMDALQDYPLDEIRSACRAAVLADPRHMPNEGHIVANIISARRLLVSSRTRIELQSEPPRDRISAEAAAEIMRAAGFAAKLMPSENPPC
jgi:hypothetical protein